MLTTAVFCEVVAKKCPPAGEERTSCFLAPGGVAALRFTATTFLTGVEVAEEVVAAAAAAAEASDSARASCSSSSAKEGRRSSRLW